MKHHVESNQGKRSQSTSKRLPILARDPLRTLRSSDYQDGVLACGRQEASRTICYWSAAILLLRFRLLPGGRWVRSLSAGHLSNTTLNKTRNPPSPKRISNNPPAKPQHGILLFMPRPAIYHIYISGWHERFLFSNLWIQGVVNNCK